MKLMTSSAFSWLMVYLLMLIDVRRMSLAQSWSELTRHEGHSETELFYKALKKANQADNNSVYEALKPNPVETATTFLTRVNSRLRVLKHALAEATWNFQMNASIENTEKLAKVTEQYNAWYARQQEEARSYSKYTNLTDDIARQLRMFTLTAIAKDGHVRRRQTDIQNAMITHYNIQVAQLSNNTTMGHRPLTVIATSRDPEVLKRAWLDWRNAIGPPIKSLYEHYVEVLNVAANENGFGDYSEYWRHNLFPDTPDLDEMLERLWFQVRPLYTQLHAYVRHKLTLRYGATVVGTDGTIPAHLLGDMWGQHWTHTNDILSPYPEMDDTPTMEAELKTRFTSFDLFQLAENFYTSLGFPEMTRKFWRKSHFVKRSGERDGSGVCQASAFDLYNREDYRIKMCAKVGLSDLKTIHHEMGHIEYFMAYSKQPTLYRAPPTAAFHESVGDIAQLSVLSDKSLQALGLVPSRTRSRRWGFESKRKKDANMYNRLMDVALDKLAFLPFGLLVDRWRWKVFKGNITPDNYNRKWWDLRLLFQGIKSPVPRSERDFDPGAKYHIPAHMPFASYFVAYIQEFQMFKALCDISGHSGLLYECDLYGSRKAGQRLREILKAGSSKPWRKLLKTLTGNGDITADAMLEYFRPLRTWLKRYNARHRQTIGWSGAKINWENE